MRGLKSFLLECSRLQGTFITFFVRELNYLSQKKTLNPSRATTRIRNVLNGFSEILCNCVHEIDQYRSRSSNLNPQIQAPLQDHNDLTNIVTKLDSAAFMGPVIPFVPITTDVALSVKIRKPGLGPEILFLPPGRGFARWPRPPRCTLRGSLLMERRY